MFLRYWYEYRILPLTERLWMLAAGGFSGSFICRWSLLSMNGDDLDWSTMSRTVSMTLAIVGDMVTHRISPLYAAIHGTHQQYSPDQSLVRSNTARINSIASSHKAHVKHAVISPSTENCDLSFDVFSVIALCLRWSAIFARLWLLLSVFEAALIQTLTVVSSDC